MGFCSDYSSGKFLVEDRGCRSDRSAYRMEVTHCFVLWQKSRLQEYGNLMVIDRINEKQLPGGKLVKRTMEASLKSKQ